MQLNQVSLKSQFTSFKDQVSDYEEAIKGKNTIIRRLESENEMLGREIDTLNK
jgi:hypothetical protein